MLQCTDEVWKAMHSRAKHGQLLAPNQRTTFRTVAFMRARMYQCPIQSAQFELEKTSDIAFEHAYRIE